MPPGGDRKLLTLHPEDEALIQAVAAANPRTVVAMMGGSAIITENWRGQVPAILMLWYPGMEGGHAFADILLGKVNPSGKLPCVFAARAEDLPHYEMNAKAITYDLWHGYRKLERDGAVPAFPFGFGLSYTTFEFAHLRLSAIVAGCARYHHRHAGSDQLRTGGWRYRCSGLCCRARLAGRARAEGVKGFHSGLGCNRARPKPSGWTSRSKISRIMMSSQAGRWNQPAIR